jgi:multiple sugar transport system permease protein
VKLRLLGVVALCAWSLAPAVWQAVTALKPDEQITKVPTVYLPRPPTLRHVKALLERKPFATYLRNSLLASAAATTLTLLAAAPAAAALTHLAARRRERFLLGFLLFASFPPILLLVPLYEGARVLGVLNEPLAIALPYAALNLPLAVWILEGALGALPRAIDEAAVLDGLSPLRRLLAIQLPLALPSLATAALLAFIFSWNEFLLALTFLSRDAAKTVTAGIASVSGASLFEIPWGPLSAAIVIATAPLVLLVLLFERKIVAGLTRGGVKG